MWNSIWKTFNDFKVSSKEDFMGFLLVEIELARTKINDPRSRPDPEMKMIHNVCEESVHDIMDFLINEKISTPQQMFENSTSITSSVDSKSQESDKYKPQVVRELCRLRTELLQKIVRGKIVREKIDLTGQSHVEKSLTLFKIQTAIEKSGAIKKPDLLLSIEAQESSKEGKLKHLFDRYKDFVLIGEPGCGKSWSLALFYEQILAAFKENVTQGAWLPCYLSVSEIMDALTPQAENDKTQAKSDELFFFLTSIIKKHPVFHKLSDDNELIAWMAISGCFMFIFDGLNEVHIDVRKEFAKKISNLRKKYPVNRFIVSSRKLHWDESLLPNLKPVIEVIPLSNIETKNFITKFFDYIEKPGDGERLIEILFRSGLEKSIEALRRNPFFLEKITQLYANTTRVPTNRGDLFRDYIVDIAEDRNWFDLQNWVLGFAGLFMTYKGGTDFSETIVRDLLFGGFASAPSIMFREVNYPIPDGYDIAVEIDKNIKEKDILAQNSKNRGICARIDGRIRRIDGRTIVIEQRELVSTSDVSYEIKYPWRVSENIRTGRRVKSGDALLFNERKPTETKNAQSDGCVAISEDDGTITVNPLDLSPDETEGILEKRIDDETNCSNVFVEFAKRFKVDPFEKIFPDFLSRIRKNKFFEQDQKPQFMHQSFQEYFAALRFTILYEQDPTRLNEFIRYRKYDEMLHIVIGCVFSEKKDVIREILRAFVEQMQIEELRDALAKSELLETDNRKFLLNLVWQIVHDVTSPDPARGFAIECLPKLVDTPKEIFDFLANENRNEQEAAWKALLNVTYESHRSNFEREERKKVPEGESLETSHVENYIGKTHIVFGRQLEEGLRSRKKRRELLITTSEWIREKKHAFLYDLLAREFESAVRNHKADLELIKAMWQTLRNSEYPLDYDKWSLALDNIDDSELYDEILNRPRSDSNYKEYFTKQKLQDTLLRLSSADNWHIPLGSLLKLTPKLSIPKQEVAESIVQVCIKYRKFTDDLLREMWGVDQQIIIDLEIDTKTLEWCLALDKKERPPSIGNYILNCINKTDPEVTWKFHRDLEMLARLADTHENQLSDKVIEVMSKIISTCDKNGIANYWQCNLFRNLQDLNENIVLANFENWKKLDDDQRLLSKIIIRKHKDKFDDKRFLSFWENSPEGHFRDLIFMGGGTDQFIKHGPELIRKVFPLWGLSTETIKNNIDFVKRFNTNNSSYSTRILIYQSLLQSEKWEHLAEHPKHPAPYKGNDAFDSLERLLRHDFTLEAAYILFNNENTWKQLEKDLPNDLLHNFEKSKENVPGFKRPDGIKPPPLDVEGLSALSVIEKLIEEPTLITPTHIPVLLRVLFDGCLGKQSKELLSALSTSNAWGDDKEMTPSETDILDIALDLGRFDPSQKDSISSFKQQYNDEFMLKSKSVFVPGSSFFRNRNANTWYGFLGKIKEMREKRTEVESQVSILPDVKDLHSIALDTILAKLQSSVFYKELFIKNTYRALRSFRKMEQISNIDETICEALSQILYEMSEKIDQESFENFVKHAMEHFSVARKPSFYEEDEITDDFELRYSSFAREHFPYEKDEIAEEIDISFLKPSLKKLLQQPPKVQTIKNSNFIFMGTYSQILSTISYALLEVGNHRNTWTLSDLSVLMNSYSNLSSEPKYGVIKRSENKKKYQLFKCLLSYLGRRIITDTTFKDLIKSKNDEFNKEVRKIESKLAKMTSAISEEVLNKALEIYPKLKTFLKEHNNKRDERMSLSELRTACCWRLQYNTFAWTDAENTIQLGELFGQLPSTLLKTLADELLSDLKTNPSVSNSWNLVRLSIIGQAISKGDLNIENYGVFIDSFLDLSKSISNKATQEAIVNIVSELTKDDKLIKKLEKIINKIYCSQKQLPDEQRLNLNETIWGIVQKIKEKTGYKIPLITNFSEKA